MIQVVTMIVPRIVLQHVVQDVHGHFNGGISNGMDTHLPPCRMNALHKLVHARFWYVQMTAIRRFSPVRGFGVCGGPREAAIHEYFDGPQTQATLVYIKQRGIAETLHFCLPPPVHLHAGAGQGITLLLVDALPSRPTLQLIGSLGNRGNAKWQQRLEAGAQAGLQLFLCSRWNQISDQILTLPDNAV